MNERELRRLTDELKQEGKAFNAWLNTQDFGTIMHMTNEKMQKCRGAWEQGYYRGKEYETD